MKRTLRNITILTGLTLTSLHVINKLSFSFNTLQNRLTNKNNAYYEWRFGKVRYIKKGEGNPLLLVHDLTPGSSTYEFKKLIDLLSQDHEVYAIDLLGYGLSDKPYMTYTGYLYIQLLDDFIKNVIGKKTDIIATGDSTSIVTMLAHNNPELVHKMIYINPQSIFKQNQIPSNQTKILKLLIEFPIIGTFIYNLLVTRRQFEKAFFNEYYYKSSLVSEDTLSSYIESAHLQGSNAKYSFSSYISRYMNTNTIHALKEINHSIFIIAGSEKEDIDNIIDNYLYYNNAIESIKIPKTKHLPHIELAEDVYQQISIFLD